MAADEDDTAAVLAALNEELAAMRGIRDPGLAPPLLDFQGPPPRPVKEGEHPAAAEFEEVSERRQEQQRASEVAHAKRDREELEAQLSRRDGEAREERRALLGYLEALRERTDETGDAMRGADFERAVERLASEGREQRTLVDEGGGGGKGISMLLAATDDPKLREELLEVRGSTA